MSKTKKIKSQLIQEEILWKDRKHWMWFPWSFTRYSVDKNRLYTKIGFFKTTEDELLLYRILDIKSSQTIMQKIFGTGTVTLYCSDQTNKTQTLKNIKDSETVRKFLSQTIEARRNEYNITGREIYGSANMSNQDLDGDGIPDFLEKGQDGGPPQFPPVGGIGMPPPPPTDD